MARSFDFSFGSLSALLRFAVPQILLLLLMLLSLMSLPVPYAGAVKPMLVMMAVYYWAIYRPNLMPPWLCFIVGVIMDILGNMPPGINAFLLVAVQWLVRDQRRFLMGQPYFTIWAMFGLVLCAAAMTEWLLFGLVYGWAPLMPVLATVLLSLFLFPFVSMLLIFTHRLLPPPPRSFARHASGS